MFHSERLNRLQSAQPRETFVHENIVKLVADLGAT